MSTLIVIYTLFTLLSPIYCQWIYFKNKFNVCSVRECDDSVYSSKANCDEWVNVTSDDALPKISIDCSSIHLGCNRSDWLYSSSVYNYDNSWIYDNCDCPLCKCDTINDWLYYIHDDGISISCDLCSCQEQSDFNYGDGEQKYNGYTCNSIKKLYYDEATQTAIDSFKCPSVVCEHNDTIYAPGSYWWDDSNTPSSCNTFCVCKSDGTYICSETYQDILNNDVLSNAFWKECDYADLYQQCKTDASLWFNKYNGFCDCPVCSCDDTIDNTTTNELHYFIKNDTKYKELDCYECTCKEFNTGLGYDCPWNKKIATADYGTSSYKYFQCPTSSICRYNNKQYYQGESWWDDNDEYCQTFCVCHSNENIICSNSSYIQIEKNRILLAAFENKCKLDYLSADCFTNSSLWHSNLKSRYSQCGCPLCFADHYPLSTIHPNISTTKSNVISDQQKISHLFYLFIFVILSVFM